MTLHIDADTDEAVAERVIDCVRQLNEAIEEARAAGLSVEVDEFGIITAEVSRVKVLARTTTRPRFVTSEDDGELGD